VLLKPCRAPKEVAEITTWADFSHAPDTGWSELVAALERAGLTPPTRPPATSASAPFPLPQQPPPPFPSPSRLDAWDRWLNVPVALKRLLALALLVSLVLAPVKILTVPPPALSPTPKVFQGHIREFPLKNNVPLHLPLGGITRGPDGQLWFLAGGLIEQMTLAGATKEFPLPSGSGGAGDITAGPDGNLWFTEEGSNRIGRITPR